MSRKRIPAPFERPSLATGLQLALGAVTLGVFLYPFVFHAFGANDNPFEQPHELLSIGLLAIGAVPALAALVVVRRLVAPLVSRRGSASR